jgi:hypothetical protein
VAVSSEADEHHKTEERISDDSLARSTGYTWSEWVAMLDAQGAADQSRAERAQFLRERYGLSLWWANTINVGYERAREDRARHEHPGAYDISVSKTFPVTVDRLFAAFVEPSKRERWLGNADLRLRARQPNRWARFDWQEGSTRLSAYFTDKGGKSAVKVQHAKLLSAEDAHALRAYWRARLTELGRALDREPSAEP